MHLKELRAGSCWSVYAIAETKYDVAGNEVGESCEVEEFYDDLGANNADAWDKLVELFDRIVDESRAPQLHLPAPICHQIEGKIWQFTAGRTRVLWFFDSEQVIICCTASLKKGKRVSKSHLRAAQKAFKEYFGSRTE